MNTVYGVKHIHVAGSTRSFFVTTLVEYKVNIIYALII